MRRPGKLRRRVAELEARLAELEGQPRFMLPEPTPPLHRFEPADESLGADDGWNGYL